MKLKWVFATENEKKDDDFRKRERGKNRYRGRRRVGRKKERKKIKIGRDEEI